MHVRTPKHEINLIKAHKPWNHHKIWLRNKKQMKMEKQEFKDEYSKRLSVKEPFGILKERFNIEKEVVLGMIRAEERLNLDSLAYNLI